MNIDFPSKEQLHLSCKDMPIFPLPSISLIPYTVLRLHVFETRYVEMLHDSMKSNRLMAIARLLDNQEEELLPNVDPIAGLGFVATIQELPEDRYLIVLIGVGRIQIFGEHQSQNLYRRVYGELMAEPQQGACVQFPEMKQLFIQLLMIHPKLSKDLQILLEEDIPPLHLINTVGHILIKSPEIRQKFLSSNQLSERCEYIISEITTLLIQTDVAFDA
jgi:uncharacterized protein